ncbi:MAG: class I SAM-dependent methyltransferase [Sphingomonas bacterium]|nr:class I SAM-dependent methyltransferase [Sphingomonas bacterium]
MREPVDRNQAWTDFWRKGGGGCLPSGSPALYRLFEDQWAEFAVGLRAGARVLDLATGDGIVLTWMRTARDDLDLVGVDLADPLPPAPLGVRMIAGVAIEDLPFAGGTFDAVVSQFGFEYGDLPRSALEAARTLRAKGLAALITHAADGPLVAHNRARASSLHWVTGDAGPLVLLRDLLDRNRIVEARQMLSQARDSAKARFGQQSPAWEICESIIRQGAMRDGVRAPLRGFIGDLERRGLNELERLSALDEAAAAVAAPGALKKAMATAGLRQTVTRPLVFGSGQAVVANLSIFERC